MSKNSSKVINLGCRLNFFESEVIEDILSKKKLSNKIVINTCAVTNQAVQNSLREVKKAVKKFPNHEIIVTGCASQVERENFENLSFVSRIVDNKQKTLADSYEENFKNDNLPEYKFPNVPTYSKNRTRATLQIQQGCNHRCTFCIIPYGRGKSLSLPIHEISNRVTKILKKGYKEITLTGVDLTSYGEDLNGKPKIGSVLKKLFISHESLERLRLSSIDPAEVDDDLIDLFKSEKRLMPHIHFSLQSGDNLILKRMKRRHNREKVIKLCKILRSNRPDLTFGADLIVGFPTETDEGFKNSLDLIKECRFTNVHIFPFSPKKGTPAARMPQIEKKIISERANKARIVCSEIIRKLMHKKIGERVNVLCESNNKSYTDDFFRVEIKNYDKKIKKRVGQIFKVKLVGIYKDFFIAEV